MSTDSHEEERPQSLTDDQIVKRGQETAAYREQFEIGFRENLARLLELLAMRQEVPTLLSFSDEEVEQVVLTARKILEDTGSAQDIKVLLANLEKIGKDTTLLSVETLVEIANEAEKRGQQIPGMVQMIQHILRIANSLLSTTVPIPLSIILDQDRQNAAGESLQDLTLELLRGIEVQGESAESVETILPIHGLMRLSEVLHEIRSEKVAVPWWMLGRLLGELDEDHNSLPKNLWLKGELSTVTSNIMSLARSRRERFSDNDFRRGDTNDTREYVNDELGIVVSPNPIPDSSPHQPRDGTPDSRDTGEFGGDEWRDRFDP